MTTSPRQLFDQYHALTLDQQQGFLALLAPTLTVEAFVGMLADLVAAERMRFVNQALETAMLSLVPVAVERAVALVRSREVMDPAAVERESRKATGKWQEHLSGLIAAEVKAKRDRRPDPNIVRRNVEMCDRHKRNPSVWSYGRLAKAYGMRPDSVRDIWKQADYHLGPKDPH